MNRHGNCEVCLAPFTYPARGRIRRFCSGACRQRNHMSPEKQQRREEFAEAREQALEAARASASTFTRACELCGIDFETTNRGRPRMYCHTCRPATSTRPTHKDCAACGERFDVPAGNGSPPKYCSEECRPTAADYMRRYYATENGKARVDEASRRSRFRTLYGVTPEWYDATLEAQGGVCAICAGTNEDERALAVDHCHETGEARALLCATCNSGIGMLKDDPAVLRAAAEYLAHHHARLR